MAKDIQQIVINSPSVTIMTADPDPDPAAVARAVGDWLATIDNDELEEAVLASSDFGDGSVIGCTLAYLTRLAREEA